MSTDEYRDITHAEYASLHDAMEDAHYADVHVYRTAEDAGGPDPSRRPWIGVRAWNGSTQVFQLVHHKRTGGPWVWVELTRHEVELSSDGYHRYVDTSVGVRR